MNRMYFFVSASNGYNRGCVQTEECEDAIEVIRRSCKVLGYDNPIITICKDSQEVESKYDEFIVGERGA